MVRAFKAIVRRRATLTLPGKFFVEEASDCEHATLEGGSLSG